MSKPHHVFRAFGPGLRLLAALFGAACATLALPSAGLWALAPLAPAGLVLAWAEKFAAAVAPGGGPTPYARGGSFFGAGVRRGRGRPRA